jgi:hypothetical protein
MKITRSDLETLVSALAVQDKLTDTEFVELLALCRVAIRTGTLPEFYAAYDHVQAHEAADYNGPAACDLDPKSILAEARRAGIKLGIDPNTAEASIREYFHLDPADNGPAETCPVTVDFFGPENEPLPLGSILKVSRAAVEAMTDAQRAEFLERLEAARNTLADCLKRYKETGTFPAGTVPAGGDFREYARTLIIKAATL